MTEVQVDTAAFRDLSKAGRGNRGTSRSRARRAVTGQEDTGTTTAQKPKRSRGKTVSPADVSPAVADSGADLTVSVANEGAETVRMVFEFKASADGLSIEAQISDGESWAPLAADTLQQGLMAILERESRLERTAAAYGLAIEALLASLEESVVNVRDQASGIPQAELEALTQAGIDLGGSTSDPSGAGQVASGLARFQQFRDDALSVAEAARALGVTDGRVRQLITADAVLTIPNGEGSYLLPRWQFAEGQLLPGIRELAQVAAEVHPLTLAGFMTRPDVDLEVDGEAASPRQWLTGGGEPTAVAELASALSIPA